VSAGGKSPAAAERLLTVEECATLGAVAIVTIRRQIKSGALRYVKVGRQFRVRVTDWESYLDSNRTASPLAFMPAKRPRTAAAKLPPARSA
jgi:excisionase family DNA binding protein